MTTAFFEGEIVRYGDHWLTADGVLYRNPPMDIEGWAQYGSPGFNQLTDAQHTLMLWGDVVGQVAQNGFVGFVQNFKGIITRAYHAVPKLEWPELTERFNRALIEQVGDPENPKVWEPVYDKIDIGGGMEMFGELLNEDEAPPEVEAEAFNDWFYTTSTRDQSLHYVGAYIRRNRDQLVRIQD